MPKNSPATTLKALYELTYSLYWAGTRGEAAAVANAESVVSILGPSTKVADINPQRLVLELKALGNSPATINRKMAALSRMLGAAVDAGMIPRKPVLPRLKEPQGRVRFLSGEEELRLFSFLEEDIRQLCVFLVETGVRTGEARALRWHDVGENSIHIRRSKGGTARSVPLTEAAQRSLASRKDLPHPWSSISASQLKRAWDRAKGLAGLGDDREVVPHCLRHTCASRLVQAGVDLLTVQKWLGHTSLTMTTRYAHLAPGHLANGARALEQFRSLKKNPDE